VTSQTRIVDGDAKAPAIVFPKADACEEALVEAPARGAGSIAASRRSADWSAGAQARVRSAASVLTCG
jgi:hypothetical protein